MNITFRSYVGEDTPVTVECHYQPAERATLTYPGCDAEITVEQVIANGILIEPTTEDRERLEQQAWEELAAHEIERNEYLSDLRRGR